ncbi:MAG: hypothetical protein V3T49_02505 [Dehalococcoidia bacterium]
MPVTILKSIRTSALLIALIVTALFAFGTDTKTAVAAGGPVLLDGGDFPDHGSKSGSGAGLTINGGWNYALAAVTNIAPAVTRAGNDGSIAVLGSVASTATSSQTGGNYHWVGVKLGKTVAYYDGTTAINQFFTDLAGGSTNPAIIVTAGTGSGNDLSGADGAALTANALAIADFVNSGGGLIGHGSGSTAFGWLTALIPGISFPGGCSRATLSLTAAGNTAFPGLTDADIRSGPCHGNFPGDFGGLGILAKDGSNRIIILGGSAVVLPGTISLLPSDAGPICDRGNHTVTATAKKSDLSPASGVAVTFTVTSGPNAGKTATITASASGVASWTYQGTGGAGTDVISATFVDADSNVQTSNDATVTWEVCNQPPDCSTAGPSVATLWPPNHKFHAVSVEGVTDPDLDLVTITIDSIRQDEPVDTFGDGNFTPDGTGVGTATADVRAERSGSKKVPGNGRVYYIAYTASDPLDATCSGVVEVGVPHDQGKQKVPVGDGPLFDSTALLP